MNIPIPLDAAENFAEQCKHRLRWCQAARMWAKHDGLQWRYDDEECRLCANEYLVACDTLRRWEWIGIDKLLRMARPFMEISLDELGLRFRVGIKLRSGQFYKLNPKTNYWRKIRPSQLPYPRYKTRSDEFDGFLFDDTDSADRAERTLDKGYEGYVWLATGPRCKNLVDEIAYRRGGKIIRLKGMVNIPAIKDVIEGVSVVIIEQLFLTRGLAYFLSDCPHRVRWLAYGEVGYILEGGEDCIKRIKLYDTIRESVTI